MELLELGENRSGEPVVLIHGFAAAAFSGWVRTGWASALERAGFRPLGVDLPGHGPEPGTDLAGTTRAGLVGRITELVDGLGAGRPVPLVGYSLGAQLAWAAAVRRPGTGPLVLGGLGAGDRLAELGRALEGAPDASPAARALAAALTGRPASGPGTDHDRRARAWTEFARRVGADPFDPDTAVPPQPALLFAGAEDPWAEPEELARRRRAAGAPTEVLLVPGRGHVDVLTARAARHGAVDFLRRAREVPRDPPQRSAEDP
ncbi:alpha/beta fold hydrolase [Kocuria rosea]|uniref:alpha/beta fold hydrolase n=1 Tax=Kocuria rosea TaxID=1275 RepID=UPI0020422A95|nr:alpha/beta hydrolase family protein [Kocuria rosea]MCM3686754.1 alpha/beta fold hydrolase [Kocuria rosea]